MSNLFSSGNMLMLAGVAVLAVAIVVLAIWTARTSARANSAMTQLRALEKRLRHVEDFLAHHSAKSVSAAESDGEIDDDDDDMSMGASGASSAMRKVKPIGRTRGAASSSGMTGRNAGAPGNVAASRQPSKAKTRKSKRDMVVPSGAAKPAPDPRGNGYPSAQSGGSGSGGANRTARPSVSQDARRRREERHQAQIRRQAEAIVQEHIRQSGSLEEDR